MKEQLDAALKDAMRYAFLRDYFALRAGDDKAAFAELAPLTGKEFDAAIDAAMQEDKEYARTHA